MTAKTTYFMRSRIGGRGDTLANSFLGSIDEAAIYYRPLSSNEVQSLYYSTVVGKCAIPPSFITQPTNQTAALTSNVVFSARDVFSVPDKLGPVSLLRTGGFRLHEAAIVFERLRPRG